MFDCPARMKTLIGPVASAARINVEGNARATRRKRIRCGAAVFMFSPTEQLFTFCVRPEGLTYVSLSG